MEYLEYIKPWIGFPVVYVIVFAVLSNSRAAFWKYLEKYSEKFPITWPKQLLAAFQAPARVLIWLIAFALAVQTAPKILRNNTTITFGIKIFCIFILGWLLNRAFSVATKNKELFPRLTLSSRALFLTTLRVVSLLVIGLIALDYLGISITPILASLGVGSIAVGLALKDTLDNFFTGFYLLIDEPIRVGDYIRVEDGVEGHVVQIGWRSTKIQIASQSTVIFPNSKLAASRLTNFEFPASESIVQVPLSAFLKVDFEKIEKLTVEIAKEVMQSVTGGVAEHMPFIRITDFSGVCVNFNVALKVKRYSDHPIVKHEFMKRIHACYQKEGFFPPPQSLIQMQR